MYIITRMAILVMEFEVCGYKNSTTCYHCNKCVQKESLISFKWNDGDLSKNVNFFFLNSELLRRNQGLFLHYWYFWFKSRLKEKKLLKIDPYFVDIPFFPFRQNHFRFCISDSTTDIMINWHTGQNGL